MSPRRVSLVVWRYARTDSPTGDMSRQVLVAHHDPAHDRFWVPTMHAVAVARDRGRTVRFWAERPVVSDLTDEDVLEACAIVENEVVDGAYNEERLADLHDRLRTAPTYFEEEGPFRVSDPVEAAELDMSYWDA